MNSNSACYERECRLPLLLCIGLMLHWVSFILPYMIGCYEGMGRLLTCVVDLTYDMLARSRDLS